MSDTHVTIVGNVVDEPRTRTTDSGIPITTFRIASSSRRLRDGQWVDGDRLFATVTCWRGTAQNVAESLHKGQPVIAVGRMYCRQYKVDESMRISYQLEADAVAHDMARGTSNFSRMVRRYAATTVEAAEDGMPADASDEIYGLVEAGPDGAPESEPEDEPELVGVG